MIIAPPGPGKCLNCGFRLIASDEAVAQACAWETVKYISKAFGDGWDLAGEKPNRVSRSKGWPRLPKDEPEEGEGGLANIVIPTTALPLSVVLGRW